VARWEDSHLAKGLVPRDFKAAPLGSLHFAPRPKFRLIPRSAWRTMIEDKTSVKAWLCDKHEVPQWDQGDSRLSPCFAIANAVSLARLAAGLPALELVPESLADEADEVVSCATALQKLASVGIEDVAGHAHTMKVCDLDCNTFDEVMTCTLRNVPVVFADKDWEHAVCAGLCARATKGLIEVLAVNSFGPDWGEAGRVWIEERGLHHPSEAYAVMVP
jgi:hypothetical protein